MQANREGAAEHGQSRDNHGLKYRLIREAARPKGINFIAAHGVSMVNQFVTELKRRPLRRGQFRLAEIVEEIVDPTIGFTNDVRTDLCSAMPPRSHPFCAHCERLRMDARGQIRRCLMDPATFDLPRTLGTLDSLEALREFQFYIAGKAAPHAMDSSFAMSQIGG